MNSRTFLKAVFATALTTIAGQVSTRADVQWAGVNLSGAEFGQTHLPGTFGSDYTYPTAAEVTYYKSKGMNFIRLPFRWERLQHTNNVPLDATEFSRMHAFVTNATAKGMYVLLDPHNFQRYYPDPANFQSSALGLVGSSVPDSTFTDFWSRVANIYKTNSLVIFGLNNEPNNMTTEQLVTSENAAIAAIRGTGAGNIIFVPGNQWTGAWSWSDNFYGTPNSVAMLNIVDPSNNIIFEAHQYLDSDDSGTHSSVVSPTIGMERLTNFTAWCRMNNFKGFLGEFAVANSVLGGTNIGGIALTNMLTYMQTNSDVWTGWAWWGGGPWWGSYMFTIEPSNIGLPSQTDQPVMGVVKHFFPLPVPSLQLLAGQVQFVAPQGFVYQPQFTPDLSGGGTWSNLGPSFPGTGTTTNFSITIGTDPGGGLYRVRVTHAP